MGLKRLPTSYSKHLWDSWMPDQAYPGTGYKATPNGWMTEEAFYAWFKNIFLKNCPAKRPLLVILDGHKTHTSIPVIDLAISEKITLLKLHHTQHMPCNL
ncbi:hypothetical protein Zmor_010608 [Zophobas morio]|uniref:DDE-1 domain-containing protein n=1 Tax=Zophobas morio TaxID=2755281 RepID=A0AA38IP27_9CUCU|nr:hypothetical protein Zmor_010608 [Zophobas morio]